MTETKHWLIEHAERADLGSYSFPLEREMDGMFIGAVQYIANGPATPGKSRVGQIRQLLVAVEAAQQAVQARRAALAAAQKEAA